MGVAYVVAGGYVATAADEAILPELSACLRSIDVKYTPVQASMDRIATSWSTLCQSIGSGLGEGGMQVSRLMSISRAHILILLGTTRRAFKLNRDLNSVMMYQSLMGAGIPGQRAGQVVRAFNIKVFWKKDDVLDGSVAKRLVNLLDRTKFSADAWAILRADVQQFPLEPTFNDNKLNASTL